MRQDHLNLMKACMENNENYEWKPIYEDIKNCYRNEIEIFVKSLTNMSKFLHEVPFENMQMNSFNIRGPFVSI